MLGHSGYTNPAEVPAWPNGACSHVRARSGGRAFAHRVGPPLAALSSTTRLRPGQPGRSASSPARAPCVNKSFTTAAVSLRSASRARNVSLGRWRVTQEGAKRPWIWFEPAAGRGTAAHPALALTPSLVSPPRGLTVRTRQDASSVARLPSPRRHHRSCPQRADSRCGLGRILLQGLPSPRRFDDLITAGRATTT